CGALYLLTENGCSPGKCEPLTCEDPFRQRRRSPTTGLRSPEPAAEGSGDGMILGPPHRPRPTLCSPKQVGTECKPGGVSRNGCVWPCLGGVGPGSMARSLLACFSRPFFSSGGGHSPRGPEEMVPSRTAWWV